ncbi:MAG TPA: VWA domain-containing protein [Cytophagaceae bacterium]|jgi:Ca-activated chloride channel family protein|nr:VWA domain-containing protein [Cytophagaceae bacterium]
MNWLREITQSEYLYITAFLIFYLAYIVRMYFISKKIKISIRHLLLKFILRSIYFSLFIIALLGPSFGDIKKEVKDIGKDIYIALDLSSSMNATDVSPSRLEKAKFELASVIKNFNSDRIGLIVFSDEAFVQCPLTYDHTIIKLFLETLSTKLLSSSGTDLAAPLELAYHKFIPTKTANSDAQTKVLLLVTDGENFGVQNPDEWVLKMKKAGIHLFFLGIGSEKGGKIPSKYDYSGHPVTSVFEEDKIKEMSGLSGNNYFEITPETNNMKNLTSKMLKVEGTLKGSRKIENAANKFFYFLFVAIILVVIDILVTVKTIRI